MPGSEPRFHAHEHTRLGQVAAILSSGTNRNRANNRALKRSVRDNVYGFGEAISAVSDDQASATQVAAIGLDAPPDSVGQDAARRDVETEARLAWSVATSLMNERRALADKPATLGNGKAEPRQPTPIEQQALNDLNARRSRLANWIDHMDYRVHRILGEISWFGDDFQKKFRAAAQRRYRPCYDQR